MVESNNFHTYICVTALLICECFKSIFQTSDLLCVYITHSYFARFQARHNATYHCLKTQSFLRKYGKEVSSLSEVMKSLIKRMGGNVTYSQGCLQSLFIQIWSICKWRVNDDFSDICILGDTVRVYVSEW